MAQQNKNLHFLFHLKIWIAVGAIAFIISYFFLDIPCALYYAQISSETRAIAKFFTNLINPNYNFYFWALVYFVGALLLKKQRLGFLCLLILISIPVANAATSILKLFLARIEPRLFLSEQLYGFTFFAYRHPYLSFPSGHAATAGAIFGAWSCYYPRLTSWFALAAFLLALTRIVLNAHFLSDVIVGTLIGLIISQWVFTLMKK